MKITGIKTKIVERGGKRKSLYLLLPVKVASVFDLGGNRDVEIDISGSLDTVTIVIRYINGNFHRPLKVYKWKLPPPFEGI